jgi:hypothetical protein
MTAEAQAALLPGIVETPPMMIKKTNMKHVP